MKRKKKGGRTSSSSPKCGAVVAPWNCWMQVRFHPPFLLDSFFFFLQISFGDLLQISSLSIFNSILLVAIVLNVAGFI